MAMTLGVIFWKQGFCHVHKKSLSVVALKKSEHHETSRQPATSPDLTVMPQVRRGIPLEPSPLNELSAAELRQFPGSIVLEASEKEGPEPGQKIRSRILKTHFKYPNIRTEEIIDVKNHSVVMRQEMVADHFLVTLASGEDPQKIFNNLGDQVTSMSRVTQNASLYRVELTSPSLEALPTALQASTQATTGTSEPDGIIHPSLMANDPFINRQWGLHKMFNFSAPAWRNSVFHTRGIDLEDAWKIRTDASSVIVAVIDSGIRYTHEDLASNMWNNPWPTAGDAHGWNALENNGDPMDNYGHGTHCAGTIGAVGNNGIGVSGVAWKVQLMACKFFDNESGGPESDEIVCIDYALNHGAKILNCSFGSYNYSNAILDAFKRARDRGVITVCAAGNDGIENGKNKTFYPSSYPLENIVSVAASSLNSSEEAPFVNPNGKDLSIFSNYGKDSVHLAAPGEEVYSTYGGSNDNDGFIINGIGNSAYAYIDGTSAAAPFVAGAFALLMAQFPNEHYNTLIERLLAATDKFPSLQETTISGGQLNVAKALGYIDSTPW